jgi:ATP-dependent Clp protease ATP-binding subunit ClpC
MYSGPLTYAIRLRRLVAQSQALAREFRSDEVHPEHLFLALLRDPEGVPAAVLAALKVNVPALQSRLEDSVPTGGEVSSTLTLFAHAVYTLFERMTALARQLDHAYVGGEHLLLAFMRRTTDK